MDQFRNIGIRTWLRVLKGIKQQQKKTIVLFIAEPQEEFFCFIPL